MLSVPRRLPFIGTFKPIFIGLCLANWLALPANAQMTQAESFEQGGLAGSPTTRQALFDSLNSAKGAAVIKNSFSIVTGYQRFQSGTLMPMGEKGSIPLLSPKACDGSVPLADCI